MAGHEPEKILTARGVTKVFATGRGAESRTEACKNVSLTISRGETVGLVGESGCGKTTLVRCLLMLLTPDEGTITFEDVELTRLDKRTLRNLRRSMQIVYQEPSDALNPLMPIYKQVTESLMVYGLLKRRERRAKAQELLELVGLPKSVAEALPRQLSVGMQQRCAIARALALKPDLLILDEPTSAVPAETRHELLSLLKNLQGEFELAYLFISHDLTLIEDICDRVLVMYFGEIVEEGRRDELFARPLHPYTQALLAARLKADRNSEWKEEHAKYRLSGDFPSSTEKPTGCLLAPRCRHAVDECRREVQELREVTPGRSVRCWKAEDLGMRSRSELSKLGVPP